jgi:hypothetical protein
LWEEEREGAEVCRGRDKTIETRTDSRNLKKYIINKNKIRRKKTKSIGLRGKWFLTSLREFISSP